MQDFLSSSMPLNVFVEYKGFEFRTPPLSLDNVFISSQPPGFGDIVGGWLMRRSCWRKKVQVMVEVR